MLQIKRIFDNQLLGQAILLSTHQQGNFQVLPKCQYAA